jgi:hypothetical protein
MKTPSLLIMIIVFSLLVNRMPVLAENTVTAPSEQDSQEKNECLLAGKHCGYSVVSIQDKIDLLNDEIDKGTTVYSLKELHKLQQKLDDVEKTLDLLLDD